jgi:hypothetical protein
MQGYDLDDTLARTDYANGPTPRAFTDAPVNATPAQDFVVVTARMHDTAEQRAATLAWLHKNQPHFTGIHYVKAGDVDTTSAGKAAVVRRLQLTDYTDNNRDILARIAKLGTGAKLWVMGGDGVRVAYADPGGGSVGASLWRVDGCRVLRADGGVVGEYATDAEAARMVERLVEAAWRLGRDSGTMGG